MIRLGDVRSRSKRRVPEVPLIESSLGPEIHILDISTGFKARFQKAAGQSSILPQRVPPVHDQPKPVLEGHVAKYRLAHLFPEHDTESPQA